MQGVPERIIARQLVYFHKADPEYGRGVAAKLGIAIEPFIPWTELSLAELAEKTSEKGFTAGELSQV
jgi:hypothetical protein